MGEHDLPRLKKRKVIGGWLSNALASSQVIQHFDANLEGPICEGNAPKKMARDGIETSTFRFSVGGRSVSGYRYDSVSIVLLSKSLHYDLLRTEVLRYVCEKLVRDL